MFDRNTRESNLSSQDWDSFYSEHCICLPFLISLFFMLPLS
jgi:hypothetical protein